MNPIKISAISYLNTVPFVYGIQHHMEFRDYILDFDVPSTCAEKLIHNTTDLGIVPVATIPDIPHANIITNYCIGAVNAVKTVVLASQRPLKEIRTLYLDPDSRTSVRLSRILARHYWQMDFEFLPLNGKSPDEFEDHEAAILIGDKTFGLERHFHNITDLAAEWFNFTGLPFVFACWVTNKIIPETILNDFEKALAYGLNHIEQAIAELDPGRYAGVDIHQYLTHTISYTLDEEKKKGMALFFEYSQALNR